MREGVWVVMTQTWSGSLLHPPPGWKANSGGPSSRTRSERIRSTVLGEDDGPIRCPPVLRVAIDFGSLDPLECVSGWSRTVGFADGKEARAAVDLPPSPCNCHADPAPRAERADSLAAFDGLRLALLLGLCTPWLYDPGRPVLWTRASLTRRLVLYDGAGFYGPHLC